MSGRQRASRGPAGRDRHRTLVNVVRYHLVDWRNYVLLPWAIMALSLVVNLIIFGVVASGSRENYSGGLLSIYAVEFVIGVVSMTRYLPYGLSLGLSRRTYYAGTALTIGVVGVVYATVLTLFQVLEGATGGWGLRIHLFRVAWMLDGPWYVSWLTLFVALVLVFLYGMWYGLVYKRWNLFGLALFGSAQVIVLLGVAVLLSLTDQWPAVWSFFGTLTAIGFTGVLAVLAAALGVGGLATIRRVTV